MFQAFCIFENHWIIRIILLISTKKCDIGSKDVIIGFEYFYRPIRDIKSDEEDTDLITNTEQYYRYKENNTEKNDGKLGKESLAQEVRMDFHIAKE